MATVATVIELMQFSSVVLCQCCNFIQTIENAPKGIQKTIDKISSLRSNQEHLQRLTEDSSDHRFTILKSLNQPKGQFEDSYETSKALE
ncbi:hypothetical protein MMC18_007209 [Xylographa bjoerkii]|nr:hypothetical protein [Xylographa bjoerkii]